MRYPSFLWVNLEYETKDSDDDSKPHLSDRCEACKIFGDCRVKQRENNSRYKY